MRGASRLSRAPVFGIAVLTPVLLAGAVAAAPVVHHQPQAAPAPAPVPAARPTPRPTGDLKIPATALAAYQKAEKTMASAAPGCGVSWSLLAGVGRIEPSLADQSRSDTPGGQGPSKLVPAAWARFAADGDGDGKTDRRDVFDASLATARYLCSSGLNLREDGQALTALRHLTNSEAYAETVVGWAETYAAGITPRTLPPIFGSVPPLYVPHPSASEPALPSYTQPGQPQPGQWAPAGGAVTGQPQTGGAPQWGGSSATVAPAAPEVPDLAVLEPNELNEVPNPGPSANVPGLDDSDIGGPDTGPQSRLSVQSGGTVRGGN